MVEKVKALGQWLPGVVVLGSLVALSWVIVDQLNAYCDRGCPINSEGLFVSRGLQCVCLLKGSTP